MYRGTLYRVGTTWLSKDGGSTVGHLQKDTSGRLLEGAPQSVDPVSLLRAIHYIPCDLVWPARRSPS